jgi:hypothetical protein
MSATGIRWVYSVLDIRAGGSSQRAADGSADLSTTQQLSSSIFLLLLQTAGGTSQTERAASWQFTLCILLLFTLCLFIYSSYKGAVSKSSNGCMTLNNELKDIEESSHNLI